MRERERRRCRRARRPVILLTVLLAALPAAAGWAQPALQVFGALEQEVAAIGTPVRLDVTVYATVPPRALPAALAAEVGRAVERGGFAEPLDGLTLIRAEPAEVSVEPTDGDAHVVRAVHRLILRPDRQGPLRVPPFRVTLGRAVGGTGWYSIEAYAVEPPFFRAMPGVVPIVAEHVEGARRVVRTGTAFLVAPDRLVTSLHVVLDARRVRVRLGGEEVVTQRAWAVDVGRDVVVLHVPPRAVARAGVHPLTLHPAPASGEAGGRVLFTAGWPGGTQRTTAGRHHADLTFFPGETTWVTGNPVRPGDSGGPLLNASGRVLGVVTAGAARPRHRDVLGTKMAIATDPRPALEASARASRPRRLHRLVRRAVRRDADGAVLRVTSYLADRRSRAMLAAARDLLEATVAHHPNHVRLRFTEGVFHRAVGADEAAEAAFRRTLDLQTAHAPAAYLLGLHLLARGEYAAAEARFEAARRAPPYEALSRFGLAQVDLRRLDYTAARLHLEALVSERPRYGPGLFALALTHLALGDEAAAREVGVHLRRVDARWAGQLRQVLRYPALQPLVRQALPTADLKLPPIVPPW